MNLKISKIGFALWSLIGEKSTTYFFNISLPLAVHISIDVMNSHTRLSSQSSERLKRPYQAWFTTFFLGIIATVIKVSCCILILLSPHEIKLLIAPTESHQKGALNASVEKEENSFLWNRVSLAGSSSLFLFFFVSSLFFFLVLLSATPASCWVPISDSSAPLSRSAAS